MARSIDNRVVSMSFDNSNFEKNAKTTINTIQRLKDATDFTKASKSFEDLERASEGLTFHTVVDGLAKVQAQFSAWEVAAMRVVQNITDKVVDAGLKMAKSLTIDQPIAGWEKYMSKTQSVQTLMNSTGQSVEEIESRLDELMWYSDQTSYGFADMTAALATMVASGGDMDNLIPMIEGIANATAFAGKGAAEFSRVIYNLNQSYSQGFLSTLDWKSVEGAGASSSALKKMLLDYAELEHTITKDQNKLENFTKLMSDKKFTNAVMEKTFGKFAEVTQAVKKTMEEAKEAGEDLMPEEAIERLKESGTELDDIALKAWLAAQQYKSFSDVTSATADAVSTNWMRIFGAIFGNLEEGKGLWSRMGDDFYQAFAKPVENLADFMEEWKSLWTVSYDNESGDALGPLTQTQALYEAISDLVAEIAESWSDIFNYVLGIDFSAEDLFNSINNLIESIGNIKQEFYDLDGFQDIPSIFARSIRILIDAFKTLYSVGIQPILERLNPVFDSLSTIFMNMLAIIDTIGVWIQNVGIKWFANFVGNVVDSLSPLIDILESLFNSISDIVDSVRKSLVRNVYLMTEEEAEEAAKNFSLFDTVLRALKTTLEAVAKGFEKTQPFTDGLKNLFTNIGKWLSGLWEKVKSLGKTIGDFFKTIFDSFDISKFTKALRGGVFTVFIASLTGLVGKLSKLDFSKITNLFDIDKLGENAKGVAEALNPFNSLAGIFGGGQKQSLVGTIKDVALAILEIAGALYLISIIKPDDLKKSVMALVATMGLVVGVIAALNLMTFNADSMMGGKGLFNNTFKRVTKMFTSIATTMILMAVALKIIDSLNPDNIVTDLLILGGLLAGVLGFVWLLNTLKIESITKGLGSLIAVSVAVLVLSTAMKLLATMSFGEIGTALFGLGGILLGIASFLVVIANLGKGASVKMIAAGVAIVGIAAALTVLSVAMKLLGSMSLPQIGKGLLAIGGLLLSIGLFAAMINYIGGGGLLFAAVGFGMLEFAVSLGLIVAALGFLTLCNPDRLLQSWLVISLLLISIGAFAAIMSATTMGGLGFIGVAAGLLVFAGALGVLTVVMMGLSLIPFETLLGSVLGMAIAIAALGATAVVLSAFTPAMLSASLGLTVFGAACVVAGLGILALSLGLSAAWDLIVTIIEDIYAGLMTLVEGVSKITKGIGDFFGWLFGNDTKEQLSQGAAGVQTAAAEGITENQNVIDSAAAESAESLTETYALTIEENADLPIEAASEMADDVIENMDREEEATDTGELVIEGLMRGLDNPELLSQLGDKSFNIGDLVISNLMAGMGEHSPSKFAQIAGEYCLEGLAIGLTDTRNVEDVAEDAGVKVIDILSESIKTASEQVEDDLQPVISPVLDLSNVENGISAMNGMFGQNGEVVNFARSAVNGNGAGGRIGSIGSINLQNAFTVNNGNNVDRQTLNSWADALTNRINENLGRLL